jgi:hypothetical protein
VATQPVQAQDEPATLRSNRRPELVVGVTRVPWVEFVCCRVGRDGNLMAAWLNRAALRLLSGPAARAGCQLVHWHGMGNRPPTRRGGRVHVSGLRHVVWFAPWSEAKTACANEQLVVRGRDLSCEAETCSVRRRLVVRGGDLSEGVHLVGNLSKKLPTS